MGNPEILPDPNARENAPIDPRSEVVRIFEALSATDAASVQPMPELSVAEHVALCTMLTESNIDLDVGKNEKNLKSLRRNQFRTRIDHPDFSSTRAKGVLAALRSEERVMELVRWSHNQALQRDWDEEIGDNPNARGRSLQQAAADILLIAMEQDRAKRLQAIGRLNQRILQGWFVAPNVTDEMKSTLVGNFVRGSALTFHDKMRGMPPGSLIDVWKFLRGETS